jgi:multiple antibiotic resistance protein
MVGAGEIFTIFLVTLGPLRLLGPFAHRTRGLDDGLVRKIALRAFLFAVVAVVAGSFVGRALLAKWHVSIAALAIAAGIIFFLVAVRRLLEQYEPAEAGTAAPLPADPTAAAIRLLFPLVLTPYGIATVIVLLAASRDAQRTAMIVALVVAVMALNLIAMLYARRIRVGLATLVLQVLGAVLEVLQVALAIQFILVGFRLLGVISA